MFAKRLIRAFHQDTALLFQFILSECITSHRELSTLVSFAEKHTFPQEVISSALIRLAGPSRDYMRLFPCGHNDGVLTKLKNNCAFFSQNADAPENECTQLHSLADKIWLLCLESLHIVQKNDALLRNLQEAHQHMRSLSQVIKRLLPHFRYDENVMFFILRHHSALNLFFNDDSVSSLCEKMYPMGIEEMESFLLNNYSERGFTHIIPEISLKIAEVRNDR